ncbi:MAG: DUF2787 family protein [Thiohalocapsa sp.]
MHVIRTGYALGLHAAFVDILDAVIDAHPTTPAEGGMCLHFRDPDYGPEHGGYHPVEIAIAADGTLLYVTDFAYVGQAPFAELAKELDFDFGAGLFQAMGRVFALEQGDALFQVWQQNFCAYYHGGVFTVAVGQL